MGTGDIIHITPPDHAILSGLLKHYLPDTAIWAFGSRVKHTASQRSDLDIAAFISPEQKESFYDLKDALDESDLPFRVDLHNWHDLPDSFRQNIQREYVVIQ